MGSHMEKRSTRWTSAGFREDFPPPQPSRSPEEGGRLAPRTYAGGDGRAALLIALGAAVTGNARHTVLAGTLARGLIAGLAGRAHGVAITGCGGHTTGGLEGGGRGRGVVGPSLAIPPRLGMPHGPPPQQTGGSVGMREAGPVRPPPHTHILKALITSHLPPWRWGLEVRMDHCERLLGSREVRQGSPSKAPRGRQEGRQSPQADHKRRGLTPHKVSLCLPTPLPPGLLPYPPRLGCNTALGFARSEGVAREVRPARLPCPP